MRNRRLTFTGGLALAVVIVAMTPEPFAQERVRSSSHPVAIGVRVLGRAGDYALAGVGGQLRLRLHDRVAVEFFMDHLAGSEQSVLRHDHEVGGNLQVHVLRTRSFALHPLLGACALLSVAHAPQGEVSANDVRFGVRAGLGAEWWVADGLTLQAQAQGVAYLGHSFDVYGASADTVPTLSVRPGVQVVIGANWWL